MSTCKECFNINIQNVINHWQFLHYFHFVKLICKSHVRPTILCDSVFTWTIIFLSNTALSYIKCKIKFLYPKCQFAYCTFHVFYQKNYREKIFIKGWSEKLYQYFWLIIISLLNKQSLVKGLTKNMKVNWKVLPLTFLLLWKSLSIYQFKMIQQLNTAYREKQ